MATVLLLQSFSIILLPAVALGFYIYLVATRRTVFRLRSKSEISEVVPKGTFIVLGCILLLCGLITMIGDIGLRLHTKKYDPLSHHIR